MRKLLIAASLLWTGPVHDEPLSSMDIGTATGVQFAAESGSPRADLDAHSDFQTDQVPHTTVHMFGRLKRRSLCFLLLIPAAVAQGPWRVIYTKAKREISHVRNMVRLLLRWIAETESTSKNGITERLHRRVEGRT